MFLSAVFSPKLFEKTALLPLKTYQIKGPRSQAAKQQPRLRSRTGSSKSGLRTQGSSAAACLIASVSQQTSTSLQTLSCLSSTSTAHSDWDTKTGWQTGRQSGRQTSKQAPFWLELREKKFIRNSPEVRQNGKTVSFLEYSVACTFSCCSPMYVYVFMCV